VKRWRHFVVVGAYVALTLVLVARVGYLNVTERDFLKDQADLRSVRMESIPAHRGVVFDRNGEPLAVSTPVISVWLDPSLTQLSSPDIKRLAHSLQLDAGELGKRLARYEKKEFVYIKRRVAPEEAGRVAELDIPGLHFDREYRRYYPAGETAAHVLGITNVDDQGQEGIELAFDEHLKGVQGKKRVLKDRRGQTIKNLEYVSAAQFGENLELSIDLRLQFFAHRELKAAVNHHGARSGSLVMLDVRTGEILAMTNQPSFNPNDRIEVGSVRNRAITDTYEPGSTVKPFTVIAALESGKFSRRSSIDTSPGYLRVGRKILEDPINRGVLTIGEVLAKSSQVGVAKVALALPDRAVFETFTAAGFGEYTGSGLPGEVSGWVSDERLSTPIVKASLAYGYGLTVTPLQLARSYLTLANGGVRLPVTVQHQSESPRGHRVFDEATVRSVLAMMERVVDETGTAPLARVPGYRVAGKTGTARKVGRGGYDDARHVAFFAGVAPANDPRVVVVVVVNEPRSEKSGGGAVAAPVFSRVVARALRVLGVEPEGPGWAA
jgi:cell division protein FtsI (penicillin-binding protein 3)